MSLSRFTKHKKEKCCNTGSKDSSAINYEICENAYPPHTERISDVFEGRFIPCTRKLIQNQSIQCWQSIFVVEISRKHVIWINCKLGYCRKNENGVLFLEWIFRTLILDFNMNFLKCKRFSYYPASFKSLLHMAVFYALKKVHSGRILVHTQHQFYITNCTKIVIKVVVFYSK